MRILDLDVDRRRRRGGRAGRAIVAGDIRDAAPVREAVDGIDVVYHNVAQVPARPRPASCFAPSTSTAPQVLLDACADAGVGKIVHTSSSAVFGVPGPQPGAADDGAPPPRGRTATAKLAAEWACLAATTRGLDVSIVRPRTILGHGRLGIFAILFDWIADGADPFVLGDGSNRYQFVHADDLAAACVLAGEHAGPGSSTSAPTASERCARRWRRSARHAGTGATVRSLPAAPGVVGDAGDRRRPADTVRPVPLADVREVDVVRHRPRSPPARLGAGVVDRRDDRPELRLVPRPPVADRRTDRVRRRRTAAPLAVAP